MRFIFAILRGALLGAIATAVCVFLYRGYILYASGASLGAVPLPDLLIEVMGLDRYAAIGAGLGAVLAALGRIKSLWAMRHLNSEPERPPDPVDQGEADAKIKSFNKAKAERYLADRDRPKR